MILPLVSPNDAATQHDLRAAKLADGAQQFEAMLLEQMLKPMQFGGVPGEEAGDTGAGDTIRTMASEALSRAIARGGGFGVAREIVRQVSAAGERDRAKV